MDTSALSQDGAAATSDAEQADGPVARVGEWTLHGYDVVPSTNLLAASLPAWHAVKAQRQTAGRGRFQRSWVSDDGGLWLSAVLPATDPVVARAVCLVAGLILKEWVESLGASGLRLRWPNDLLAGERKLAGILVDRFSPNTVVLGIGLNVQNHPESADPSLQTTVARLVDCVPALPTLPELTASLLNRLGSEWRRFVECGSALPVEGLNRCWGTPREVELDLDGRFVRGLFAGVDEEGRVALQARDSSIAFYAAHQVRHLTELEVKSEP